MKNIEKLQLSRKNNILLLDFSCQYRKKQKKAGKSEKKKSNEEK